MNQYTQPPDPEGEEARGSLIAKHAKGMQCGDRIVPVRLYWDGMMLTTTN